MEILKAKEVSEHLKVVNVPFKDEIESLKKGEAIKISKSEWKKKSPPRQYYYQNLNKIKQTIKIVDAKEHWLFIKV